MWSRRLTARRLLLAVTARMAARLCQAVVTQRVQPFVVICKKQRCLLQITKKIRARLQLRMRICLGFG